MKIHYLGRTKIFKNITKEGESPVLIPTYINYSLIDIHKGIPPYANTF